MRARKMCDHVFIVLAKKATKYSIMAVSQAASDEGVSSTASGTQQHVSIDVGLYITYGGHR